MTQIWQVIHDGGTVECHTLQDAQKEFAIRENARVVELAPVDPLERAVVEAAVAYARAREPDDDASQDLCSAVDALLAARGGA